MLCLEDELIAYNVASRTKFASVDPTVSSFSDGAFTPDGSKLAASNLDQKLRVVDTSTCTVESTK